MICIATRQRIVYAARMALTDDIKRAVEAWPESRNRLANAAGLSPSALCRLMSGERGLSVDSLERLAEALGYEIVMRPKRRPRKGV